jgi:hypothetical protein
MFYELISVSMKSRWAREGFATQILHDFHQDLVKEKCLPSEKMSMLELSDGEEIVRASAVGLARSVEWLGDVGVYSQM